MGIFQKEGLSGESATDQVGAGVWSEISALHGHSGHSQWPGWMDREASGVLGQEDRGKCSSER